MGDIWESITFNSLYVLWFVHYDTAYENTCANLRNSTAFTQMICHVALPNYTMMLSPNDWWLKTQEMNSVLVGTVAQKRFRNESKMAVKLWPRLSPTLKHGRSTHFKWYHQTATSFSKGLYQVKHFCSADRNKITPFSYKLELYARFVKKYSTNLTIRK